MFNKQQKRQHSIHDFPKGLIVIEMFIQLVKSPQNIFLALDLFFWIHSFYTRSLFAIIACIQPFFVRFSFGLFEQSAEGFGKK